MKTCTADGRIQMPADAYLKVVARSTARHELTCQAA